MCWYFLSLTYQRFFWASLNLALIWLTLVTIIHPNLYYSSKICTAPVIPHHSWICYCKVNVRLLLQFSIIRKRSENLVFIFLNNNHQLFSSRKVFSHCYENWKLKIKVPWGHALFKFSRKQSSQHWWALLSSKCLCLYLVLSSLQSQSPTAHTRLLLVLLPLSLHVSFFFVSVTKISVIMTMLVIILRPNLTQSDLM